MTEHLPKDESSMDGSTPASPVRTGKNLPQAMHPHGILGAIFGWSMDVFNRSAHKHALERLAVQPSDRILEIGFGTGQLIGMLAKAASSGFVAGVDPSPLMLSTAWKRNERWIHAGRVDLRLGTASSLAWADGTFDKATALHNFQFWSDPEHDLSEVARVLRPGGLLLLVLRTRDRRSDKHPVSNPLSREGNEGQKALAVLSRCGFEQARLEGEVGTSAVLTAITQVSEYP